MIKSLLRQKRTWALLGISLLVLLFFSYYINKSGKKNTISELNQNKLKSAPKRIPVLVKNAFTGNLVVSISAQGYTEAIAKEDIVLQTGGYINHLSTLNGQVVNKNDLLVRLENRDKQVLLSEAKSKVINKLVEFGVNYSNPDSALAYVKAHLFTELSGKNKMGNINPDIVFDGKINMEMKANASGLTRAWNEYQQALIAYRHTFYYAPFHGVVGDIQLRKGEYIGAFQKIGTIYNLDRLKIVVPVLEDEVVHIQNKSPVQLEFSAFPDKIFSGKVIEINPAINKENHTALVGIELPNPDHRLKPGMTARVKIQTRIYKNRLLVPKEAVLTRDNRQLVFVVRDSVANWCYVKTGKKNDQFVEILSSEFNLKANEAVIVEGQFSLAHGAMVTPKRAGRQGSR